MLDRVLRRPVVVCVLSREERCARGAADGGHDEGVGHVEIVRVGAIEERTRLWHRIHGTLRHILVVGQNKNDIGFEPINFISMKVFDRIICGE